MGGVLNIVGSGGLVKKSVFPLFFLKEEKQIAMCLASFECEHVCIHRNSSGRGCHAKRQEQGESSDREP